MSRRESEKKAGGWGKILRHMEDRPRGPEPRRILVSHYYRIIESIIRPLLGFGISPNVISVVSLLIAFVSAFYYSRGSFFLGGIFLLFTGFLDTLDGTIARLAGQSSKFGALLDSTLDRYAEFLVFFGLLTFYRQEWIFYVVLFAMMGSVMVSYIKARSQSLGKTRSVGLMQRPERLILLILGSFLNTPFRLNDPDYGDGVFLVTLVVLAVLTNITALRRLYEGKKDLERGT